MPGEQDPQSSVPGGVRMGIVSLPSQGPVGSAPCDRVETAGAYLSPQPAQARQGAAQAQGLRGLAMLLAQPGRTPSTQRGRTLRACSSSPEQKWTVSPNRRSNTYPSGLPLMVKCIRSAGPHTTKIHQPYAIHVGGIVTDGATPVSLPWHNFFSKETSHGLN